MIIRKLYKFENAHIVRNCSTERCKFSIHGHSYKCEILLESKFLDEGQMVVDFGLLKQEIHEIIDSFDHSICIWNKDKEEYRKAMKEFSARWIELPISPSAEQLSRVFFLLIDNALSKKEWNNGEKGVKLYSVIVHETDTGYAQCFREDIDQKGLEPNPMGFINPNEIVFSEAIKAEWKYYGTNK